MTLLACDQRGTGRRFVWLHGFTQTRHSANEYLSILAGNAEILTPDLPGHGASASIWATLTDTADMIDAALLGPTVALGGYSMGGRVALVTALAHPDHVERLVLVSASMGIADEMERAARRERDNLLAERIRDIGSNDFLTEWLAQPMFATLGDDDRSTRSHDGEGLARSLEHSGVGAQDYVAAVMHRLTMPVLIVCGSRDEKFMRAAHDMTELVPQADLVVIPDAGHAVHLEQPQLVAGVVSDFLR